MSNTDFHIQNRISPKNLTIQVVKISATKFVQAKRI